MAADPLTRADAAIALVGAYGEDYGRILRANGQLAALLGVSAEELVGTRACRHVHPASHPQVYEAFLRLVRDPHVLYESDTRLLAATGRAVPVHVLASMITMRAGAAIVVRLTDISR